MTRKKVLILPAWYPSPEHPVNGIFVKDQAECLAAAHDVTVLAPRVEGMRTGRLPLFQPAPVVQTGLNGLQEWHVTQRVLPPLSALPVLRRYLPAEHPMLLHARRYWMAVERGFQDYLSQHGLPDVIHAHVVLPAGWAAARLGAQYDVPTVLTEHSGPFSVHLETPRQRQMVREAFAGLDRVLAVSPALVGHIRRYFPDVPVGVLGNVVRSSFFTPGPSSRSDQARVRFFCLALLCEAKGVQHLLEAAHLLLRRGVSNFEIVVGGDGPYRATLEELAGKLGLASHCHFTGLLDRDQVRGQLRDCDVFALPSLGETFCLVLAEAMACGKPVISTRCGGPEYVVTPECGRLVEMSDPAGLSAVMEDHIHGTLRYDPAEVRRSACARFGEEAFVRNLSAVYDEVCAAGPRKTRVLPAMAKPGPRTGKPSLLMLSPHEPTLDPRVHYTANALASEYDVTVLSTVYPWDRRPDENLTSKPHYETVRIAMNGGTGLGMFREYLRLALTPQSLPGGPLRDRAALAFWALIIPGAVLGVLLVIGRLPFQVVRRVRHAIPEPTWKRWQATPCWPVLRLLLRLARLPLVPFRLLFGPVLAGTRVSVQSFRHTFATNAVLWDYVREYGLKPQAVYCHDLYSLQTAVLLKRVSPCTIIYDSHEYYPHLYHHWPYGALTGRYEKTLVADVDVYLTVSPQLADELGRVYHNTVHSLPNVEPEPRGDTVPLQTGLEAIAAGRLKVLYQGSFAPGRGLEEVLRAWQQIDPRRAVLFLRGPKNPERDAIERLAREMGLLGQGVHVLPPVVEKDLIPGAAEADVGLIPYKGDSPAYRFACPNKLSQYVHAGLAVLGSDIPYVEQMIVGHAIGATYSADRPETLAAAVERLAADPELLATWRANARRLSRTEYRWERYEPELLRLVRSA